MMVKELPLSSGGVTLVDDDVYEWASQYTWRRGGYKNRYARRQVHRNYKQTTIYLHRAILGVAPDVEVDHRNRNPLDNRRENLRPATTSQNHQNQVGAHSSTGVRGVRWHKRFQVYEAFIYRQHRRIYVGRYQSLGDAEQAVKDARRRFYTHAPENN